MKKGRRLLLAEEVSVLNRFGGVHVTSGDKARDFRFILIQMLQGRHSKKLCEGFFFTVNLPEPV